MAAEPSKKIPRSAMYRIAAGFIRLPPRNIVIWLTVDFAPACNPNRQAVQVRHLGPKLSRQVA